MSSPEVNGLLPDNGAPGGLRERKKAKTRAAVQHEALRLFREQGYEAARLEQIAEVVEISPSAFSRYFRANAKEDLVLTDDFAVYTLAGASLGVMVAAERLSP